MSISSLSDSETENESENEDDVGVELKTIGNILVSFCCKKYCLRHLTVMDAINSRKEMFLNKNKADQKRWLHQKLTDSSSQSNTDGTIDTTYSVAGKKVCPMAWCKVYSLSERTLRRLHRKITFCDSLSHGNSGKKRQNTLTETAAAWMERYFSWLVIRCLTKIKYICPAGRLAKMFTTDTVATCRVLQEMYFS